MSNLAIRDYKPYGIKMKNLYQHILYYGYSYLLH